MGAKRACRLLQRPHGLICVYSVQSAKNPFCNTMGLTLTPCDSFNVHPKHVTCVPSPAHKKTSCFLMHLKQLPCGIFRRFIFLFSRREVKSTCKNTLPMAIFRLQGFFIASHTGWLQYWPEMEHTCTNCVKCARRDRRTVSRSLQKFPILLPHSRSASSILTEAVWCSC